MIEEHCCEEMIDAVNDKFCPIFYNERLREYGIEEYDSDTLRGMTYCYHCGTKLPESLRDLWFNTLRNEYRIERPSKEYKKAPKEFHTDEWWKKRGL